jgi:hypothetical protein
VHVGGTTRRGAKFLPKIKFSHGQISLSVWGPPTLQNGILRNGQKKLKTYGSFGMVEKQEF